KKFNEFPFLAKKFHPISVLVNTMDQAQVTLLEDQSSREKRKQFFIFFLIILFTLIFCAIISIFTVLKHHTESQSLSVNSVQAIRSACRVTRYYYTCIDSISSQNNHNPIHASDIFRLSIRAAFHEFYIIGTLPQELASKIQKNIRPLLTNCQNLFTDSLNQLNRSLIMTMNHQGPDEEIWAYNDEMMTDLRNMIFQAKNNVDRCLDGLEATWTAQGQIGKIKKLKMRIHKAEIYMSNCLAILEKRDAILEMFDPSVQSILASFMWARENYVLTIALFCSQYLVLVFLFCSLLRVFVSRTRK
ncbi:hypothetical protein Pfo_020653, partial [Paulownia fortunei]